MRRAFTLLEVLVALAVLALSVIVLGSAYLNVLNAYDLAGRSNAYEEDIRFARAQLLAEPDRTKAEAGQNFDTPGGRHLRWEAKIEDTEMPNLFRVAFTCEISGTDGKDVPPVKETFMLTRPTWADATANSKLMDDAKQRIVEQMQKLNRP
jgi:prepilin-type N-terminal cleavage/methylation domain-containing protein